MRDLRNRVNALQTSTGAGTIKSAIRASNAQRVEMPDTLRTPYTPKVDGQTPPEEVNHIGGDFPLVAPVRPTPAGPKATAAPHPTAGQAWQPPMTNSAMTHPTGAPTRQGQEPARQGHASTEEIMARPLFMSHNDYVVNLDRLVRMGSLDESSNPLIRRALERARSGDREMYFWLHGLVGGWAAGLKKGATQEQQRAVRQARSQPTTSAQPAEVPLQPYTAGVERMRAATRAVRIVAAEQQREAPMAAELVRVAVALQPGRSGASRTGKH